MKVLITRDKLDDLAVAVAEKAGLTTPLTIAQMQTAVENLSPGGGGTLITKSINANGTYTARDDSADGYSSVTVNVPTPTPTLQTMTKTYTPTESAQTESVSADSGYDAIDTVNVTVNAISPTYVGSGITRRAASDLTESDGVVTAPSGYYENPATKSITLTPYTIRPDAELLQTYTYDKYLVADEEIAVPTYSTTAKTLKAAASLTPTVSVDMNNYRYFVIERFLSIPEYSVTSKAKGRAEYTWCSYFFEVTRSAANEFPTIIDPTKVITSAQTLWASNQLYRLLYWSSSSATALYATNGYGVYQTPSTPSLSGSTLTLKSPAFGARGHTTYFTQTYMNALTDIRYQYVIEVYRAPLNALGIYSWGQDTMLQHMISCIDDTNHKLT